MGKIGLCSESEKSIFCEVISKIKDETSVPNEQRFFYLLEEFVWFKSNLYW